MPYYQHHIGDFIKATSRLSDAQAMAYLRLIWMYYDSEKPLPDDVEVLAMQVGSTPHDVNLLLRAFFKLDKDGWRQTRCDQEIADYHAYTEKKSNAGKASAQRRMNKSLTTAEQVLNECSTDVQLTNNQQPLTTNQQPLTNIEVAKATRPRQAGTPPAPIQEIVDMYNSQLPMLSAVTVVNDSRRRAISARWREVVTADKLDREKGLEFFQWFFEMVSKSKFLTGRVKDWKADIDFLFNASKFPRIVEGAYHKE